MVPKTHPSAAAQYVQDNTPVAETRCRGRFLINPNALPMALNNQFLLFRAYSGSGTTTPMLKVELKCATAACSSTGTGSYQIGVSSRDNASGWTLTTWITVPKSTTSKIEFEWKAASSSTAADGYLTVWVDGTQRDNRTGLTNGTRRVDMMQLGMVGERDTGTTGAYVLDYFESRRISYIGQAPGDVLGWASKPLFMPARNDQGRSPSTDGLAAPASDISGTVLITTTIAYTYDPLGRLTAARYSDGRSFEYTYDSTGNRLAETTATGTPAIPNLKVAGCRPYANEGW